MTRRPLIALAAAAGALTLVVGIDSATYAATGSSLILGRSNTADTTTTMRATKGPVLDLRPGASSDAPLTVSGTGKVWNLNVDRLDSLDSRDFQRRLTSGCGTGRALVGVSSTGTPSCAPIEPTTLIVRLPGDGRFDAPFGVTTADVPSGRYRVELATVLEPTVPGTSTTPKQGSCTVVDGGGGRTLLHASGRDTGSGAVPLNAAGLVSVAGHSGLDVVCGFPRGTWGFGPGGAAVLTLTPVPHATSVPLVESGDRDGSDLG